MHLCTHYSDDNYLDTAMRKLLPILLLVLPVNGVAEDWPARMHDAQRSGVVEGDFSFPLRQQWVHRARWT